MLNTGDIHKAEEAAKDELEAKNAQKLKMDREMLIMDMADTLRHEAPLMDPELSGEQRRAAMLFRLKEIYEAQGMDVEDDVYESGILAYEEGTFDFVPPKKSFGLSLAKLYISRGRWLPLMTLFALVTGGAWGINHLAFERPAKIKQQQMETLLQETLPEKLIKERDEALTIASNDDMKSKVNGLYDLANNALEAKDAGKAEGYLKELTFLNNDLGTSYEVRVVSRPNEFSGIFRVNDKDSNVKNYYLIVEALNAAGEVITVPISSEEDGKSDRVRIWGVRVPEAVFNRVAADKRDDQIIQDNLVGVKKRGVLEPDYKIKTSGRKILEW